MKAYLLVIVCLVALLTSGCSDDKSANKHSPETPKTDKAITHEPGASSSGIVSLEETTIDLGDYALVETSSSLSLTTRLYPAITQSKAVETGTVNAGSCENPGKKIAVLNEFTNNASKTDLTKKVNLKTLTQSEHVLLLNDPAGKAVGCGIITNSGE